ncbi:MAG TPA: SRPBCC family protein [Rhodanobacteraceae bacterium]|nr:SRPBCC family protein [Rhodanobacteraceae bacterium]
MKISESTVDILAPASEVWLALTTPDLVKRWQYGSDLLTTWQVGTPIVFRNEWNGRVFEQKGIVLEFVPESRLKYSLFFPRSDLKDLPENYFFMTYELTEGDKFTSLRVRQEDPRPSPPNEASGGSEGPDVLSYLKELVEVKMTTAPIDASARHH